MSPTYKLLQLNSLAVVLIPILGCTTNIDQPSTEPRSTRTLAETQATEDAPLSEEEIKEVEKYMRIVAGAFSSMNAEAIESLSHPGGDPRGKKNTVEYNQMLMDGGDRVKSWTAKRYARPDWEYLETSDFYPVPTVWIDVTLSDGKRDYPIFFALAPDSGGQLLQCYYVDKK